MATHSYGWPHSPSALTLSAKFSVVSGDVEAEAWFVARQAPRPREQPEIVINERHRRDRRQQIRLQPSNGFEMAHCLRWIPSHPSVARPHQRCLSRRSASAFELPDDPLRFLVPPRSRQGSGEVANRRRPDRLHGHGGSVTDRVLLRFARRPRRRRQATVEVRCATDPAQSPCAARRSLRRLRRGRPRRRGLRPAPEPA